MVHVECFIIAQGVPPGGGDHAYKLKMLGTIYHLETKY